LLAYFKNRKTFRTIGKATPQSWDVPLIASTSESGTISIPAENKKNYSGEWIYFANQLFLVDESTPKDGLVDLKVSDPAHLFDRQLIYPSNPESTYGAFIASAIRREYINCSDAAYQIDYISVNNEDSTPFEEPKLDSANLYSLFDVISTAREKGVVLDFEIAGPTQLNIHIHTNVSPRHNIVFNDGHSELSDETFSRNKTAKITVLKATDTEGVYTTTTWYLSADGEISQTVPSERAEGNWEYLTISKDENARAKAKEKFSENIASHKIEFYSDRIYNLWDTVCFKIDGELTESRIVGIFISSDHIKYLYRCGDLATTLTEKVQKLK
jgi:hypothetical protein